MTNNTSTNWLEKAISEKVIKSFKYNEFTDRTVICKCKFEDCGESTVALKRLKVDKSLDETSIINELKFLQIRDHPNIIKFYGITKDENENYIVLQHSDENLRKYLYSNFGSLEDKLRIAEEISYGLLFLHRNDIIHRDLHPKNILIHRDPNDPNILHPKIAYFGQQKQINETSNSISLEMIPYVEPECLVNRKYQRDKRSDVYSFGVILWEISSGKLPFKTFKSKDLLIDHVNKGNREEPIEGTPTKYIELYKSCWDKSPVKRPETESIFVTLNKLIGPTEFALFTGFEPFGEPRPPNNPSWEAVRRITKRIILKNSDNSERRIIFDREEIPVEYDAISKKIPQFHQKNDEKIYKFYIHVGHGHSGDIYIEKKARQKEYKSRDNHQKIPDDYICPGYDCDEIKTQIDVDSLKKYLQEEKKLTNLLTSEDAGLYLCEYTYYISLCENEKKDDKKKVLFVHVPKKNDSFPYSVDEVAKILEDIGEWVAKDI